ncbi:hypothetical protein [Ileibacterium valens]|uniref:hypothetical protein n=1 Tax=Ileibacterium valens TaxID=1862668 RepID=UPI0023533B75|nr:hypothetical protein [Ileibacterium valens]
MLADEKMMLAVEQSLKEQGVIEQFEHENGPVRGRMMITIGEVPENLVFEVPEGFYPFIGTFDFYDSQVGVVFNPATMQAASGIWTTPQKSDAEAPDRSWIDFFVQTLVQHVQGESFGLPVYSFVTDESDLTIVPSLPE